MIFPKPQIRTFRCHKQTELVRTCVPLQEINAKKVNNVLFFIDAKSRHLNQDRDRVEPKTRAHGGVQQIEDRIAAT